MSPPTLVYGGYPLQPNADGEVDHVVESLDVLWNVGVKNIDTAQIYGRNEEALSKANTKHPFVIDTKFAAGFNPGFGTYDNAIAHGTEAGKGLKNIDIYYLHAPDSSTSVEPVLDAVQDLYKAGVFKRFGLSNFSAEEVEKVYTYQKSKGNVLPTVFQGNYNPFARNIEETTFPKLRELGIAFYAYSPLAGGFLAKTRQQIETAGGRWEAGTMLGDMYRSMYGKEAMLDALDAWGAVAQKEGISAAELGYRWTRFHSALEGDLGDAVIFGANTDARIKETVAWLEKGPLSKDAAQAIDEIWEKIKSVAPHDNYKDFIGSGRA